MITYGARSARCLAQLCEPLQCVLRRYALWAPSELDIAILCGHRNQEDQDAAYARGTSQVKWPNSYHNHKPSRAFDFAPCPINWEDHTRFAACAGALVDIGRQLGYRLTWGGEWGSRDLAHIQFEGKR